MQIYGIDLAKEKFDVSFLRLSSKSNVVTPVHHVVRNTENGIKAFLKGLPSDSVLVAEHTGVYGERLLKMCTEMNVKIAYVGGHVIHTYKSGPDRGKTDEQDCNVLREFGERFTDKLVYTTFPEEDIYELRQLSRQRTMLVEERKRIITADKTEDCRPYRSEAVKRSMQHIVDLLDEEIKNMERDMLTVIRKHDKISNSYDIITSVNGVGLVTAVELSKDKELHYHHDSETILRIRRHRSLREILRQDEPRGTRVKVGEQKVEDLAVHLRRMRKDAQQGDETLL